MKKRVIAVESVKEGIMRYYGEGELLENKVPDCDPYNEMGISNPCIKLDSGKYVWGFQCWWADNKVFRNRYKDHITEELIVDVENEILPVEE